MTVIHKTFAEKISEALEGSPLIPDAVKDYLEENPPAGGLTIEEIKSDYDIADALIKKHASGSDNQDLSGLQPKEIGKGLSANDYTDIEKEKLSGIEANANNYILTKAKIETELTGPITSHSHASSGGLTQQQILRLI
jgi:hypothetical protein